MDFQRGSAFGKQKRTKRYKTQVSTLRVAWKWNQHQAKERKIKPWLQHLGLPGVSTKHSKERKKKKKTLGSTPKASQSQYLQLPGVSTKNWESNKNKVVSTKHWKKIPIESVNKFRVQKWGKSHENRAPYFQSPAITLRSEDHYQKNNSNSQSPVK